MLNSSAPKFFQLSAAAALALALTACGGGGGGGDDSSSSTTSTVTTSRPSTLAAPNKISFNTTETPDLPTISSVINTPQLNFTTRGFPQAFSTAVNAFNTTIGDAVLRAFKGPEITSFDASVIKMDLTADNGETITGDLMKIPDPILGTINMLISERDSNGSMITFNNINGLNDSTSETPRISNAASLLGNRAGMLCVADDSNIDQRRGEYVYLSDAFIEVNNKEELVGKKYATFINCDAFQVKEFDNINKLTNVENPQQNEYGINWAPFAKAGEQSKAGIKRAKAYKANIAGKNVYAIVRTTQTDEEPNTSKITLSIGLE